MKRFSLLKLVCITLSTALASLLGAHAAASEEEPGVYGDTETYFGITVRDPYRWMEDFQSEEVIRWSGEQTRRTSDFVASPELEAMRERIFELSNFDLRYAAKIRGDRLFFLKRPKGGRPAELWFRQAESQLLVLSSDNVPDDTMEQSYIGGRNFGATFWPDRTGNMVAYGYNDGASRGFKIRVIETRTGLHLEDVISEVGYGLLSLVWDAEGRGFYYARAKSVPVEDESGERIQPLGVFYHLLGSSQQEDRAIVARGDERLVHTPYVSVSGQYLIVAEREGLKQENRYLVYNTERLQQAPVELFAGLESMFRFLGDEGNRLYFQTYHNAPNGRVIYVELNDPETLVEVVAETDRSMLVGSSVGGDIIGYADGHFLVGFLQDGVPEVAVYNSVGVFLYTLDLPEGKTIWGGVQGVANEPIVSISALSALAPSEISTVDVRSGTITKVFETPVSVKQDDFVIERVLYPSFDGTRVPMYVARHKRTSLNGNNPAFIYGYGMHGWVSFLFYQPHIVHWLEMGGVYAMPAIRGGGEYGADWHQAGIRANRQNAVDDFVAAGQWLIDKGYTNNRKLAANGSSASGPLGGIAAVRYSHVFAASTVDYPVADMVRAPLFGNGALMIEEYGSLEVEAEAKSIIHQSPYHQAQSPACRVPTLVMVGDKDKVVLPFHGLKFAAVMQDMQTCDQPILFRLMPDTGHNYGNSPEGIAENTAIQLMFLKRVLDF